MNKAVPIPSAKGPALKIEAFVQSKEARDAVEQIASQVGKGATASFHTGTLVTAARLAGIAFLGDILIVEAGSEPQDTILELVSELAQSGPRLVVLGNLDDALTLRRFLAAGAQDYLVLPMEAHVKVMLDHGLSQDSSIPTPAAARTIAICGVTGGVGASVLATNLAVAYVDTSRAKHLPRDMEGKVALVDGDLAFGSLAIDLNVEMTNGFIEALQVPDRVDTTFLLATMAEPLPGLHIYTSELNDAEQLARCIPGVAGLLRRLRSDFPTVVVDLPRNLLLAQPELIKDFDEIVFVMGPGFSAVRGAIRLAERLKDYTHTARISYVLSQTRQDAGLKKSEIATALEGGIALEFPNCASELSRAFVKGQPLQRIVPRSRYAKTVNRLLKHIETPAPKLGASKAKKWGFWKSKV